MHSAVFAASDALFIFVKETKHCSLRLLGVEGVSSETLVTPRLSNLRPTHCFASVSTSSEVHFLRLTLLEIHKLVIRLREQASQLMADKRFLSDSIADIAHQLRTPLTSMNIVVDMFSEAELSDDKRFDLLGEMMQGLNRIEWLINTLLKMSKIDADTVFFEAKEYNVKEMLKRASDTLAVPLDINGVTLTMNVPDDAIVRGDMMWTCEAIGNILKNCMEHTPSGGKIEINVKHTPIYTEIVVMDTGTGIDPEDIPHVFERFYRGKVALNTSIGIGLALSKMIVERQNGTIRAGNREEPETGAVFTVRFYSSKR